MLLALVVLAVVPAAASASGQEVIDDCSDNEQIDGDYSQGDYNQALDELPADIDGYSPCRDVITRARDDAAAGGGRSGGRGGPRGGLAASGGNAGADFGGLGGSFFGGSDSAALPGTPGGPPNTGDPLENVGNRGSRHVACDQLEEVAVQRLPPSGSSGFERTASFLGHIPDL